MSALARVAGVLAGWRGYAVAALLGAIVVGGSTWTVRGWLANASEARAASDRYKERLAEAEANMAAIEAAREEGRRRTAEVEKVRDEAKKQAAAAAASAASARTERNRLRERADALARAASGRDPSAADGSPSGADGVDLLAYMLGRVSDRAAELAGIADEARVAGLTCERVYDALRQL